MAHHEQPNDRRSLLSMTAAGAAIAAAARDGFSTSGGPGNGVPGLRRLLDGLEVTSGLTGTMLAVARHGTPATSYPTSVATQFSGMSRQPRWITAPAGLSCLDGSAALRRFPLQAG
jgi:hypothetical protein